MKINSSYMHSHLACYDVDLLCQSSGHHFPIILGASCVLMRSSGKKLKKTLKLYSGLWFKCQHLVHFKTTPSHKSEMRVLKQERKKKSGRERGRGHLNNLVLNSSGTICLYIETKKQNTVHATGALSRKTQDLSWSLFLTPIPDQRGGTVTLSGEH